MQEHSLTSCLFKEYQLNNYFNTDQEVTLVVSEWKYQNRLTSDEKEVISDPRIKIITKNNY